MLARSAPCAHKLAQCLIAGVVVGCTANQIFYATTPFCPGNQIECDDTQTLPAGNLVQKFVKFDADHHAQCVDRSIGVKDRVANLLNLLSR